MVVGLGNPGTKYAKTRHNAGFMVVDAVAGELNLHLKKPWLKRFLLGQGRSGGRRIILAKPLTFMNESGQVVPAILAWAGSGLADLLVVYDNADISPGNCRLKLRGSGGGHNGLESVIRGVRGTGFMRLSVGVGRPPVGGDLVRRVLAAPSGSEVQLFEQGVQAAAAAVLRLFDTEAEKVMNDLNRRES